MSNNQMRDAEQRCISLVLSIIVVSAVLAGCGLSNGVVEPGDDADGRPTWTTTNVRVTLREGPADADAPRPILRDLSMAFFPEGNNATVLLSRDFYRSADTLRSLTGEAIAGIREWNSYPPQLRSELSFVDPLENLSLLSQNPVIRGLLMRRSVRKEFWSSQARVASATVALAQGSKVALQVIPSPTSLALAASLANIGAIEAIVVDVDGEVVSATNWWFYPSLHKQMAWQALKEASGEAILVTLPFEESPYDVPLRKVAVPVHDVDGTTLIGWILAKVYAFEFSSQN